MFSEIINLGLGSLKLLQKSTFFDKDNWWVLFYKFWICKVQELRGVSMSFELFEGLGKGKRFVSVVISI